MPTYTFSLRYDSCIQRPQTFCLFTTVLDSVSSEVRFSSCLTESVDPRSQIMTRQIVEFLVAICHMKLKWSVIFFFFYVRQILKYVCFFEYVTASGCVNTEAHIYF